MVEITISGGVTISGLSEDERQYLQNETTFDNPKYEQARRFSKHKQIYVPKTISYSHERSIRTEQGTRKKVLTAPIGVLNLFDLSASQNVKIEDKRVVVEQNYPDFKMELRNDQRTAFEHYMENDLKNVVQLPTGKGKTILALYIAQHLKQRALVLVHKDDLVVGWKKDIEQCFGGKVDVGLIKGKSDKIGKHITIATVQTLARKSEDYMELLSEKFGLVIQDEVHHVGANTFNIVDLFNSRYKLGLSATPKRTDGLTHCLDLYYGGLCHVQEMNVDDEDLCGAEIIVRQGRFKFLPFVHEGVILNFYDYGRIGVNDRYYEDIPYKDRPRLTFMELDNLVVSDSMTKIMVCKDIIREYREGHNCIVFFTQKDHIRQYYSYLKRYIPEETMQMFYGDNNESSDVMMERAESGQCRVTLATFSKATEGTNVKAWEVGFLVSSMNNEKNIKQCIGRLLRKKEGKLDPVRVYDYQYMDVYGYKSHFRLRESVYNSFRFPITGEYVPSRRAGK